MTDEYLVDTDGDTSALMSPQKNELAYINPNDLPDLDQAEVGFSLEAKYMKFSTKGQTMRAIFNGFTTIRKNENGEIKPMPAVVLQNKEGLFLNSTSNILDQLTRIPPGTAVQITYTGDEKTANGYNVKKFDIRVLNVKPVPMVSGTTNFKPGQTESKPAQSQSQPALVSKFWAKVYELGLTNIEGKGILDENRGNFVQAYKVLVGEGLDTVEPVSNTDTQPF